MLRLKYIVIGIVTLLLISMSANAYSPLSDKELSNITAQNGLMINQDGTLQFNLSVQQTNRSLNDVLHLEQWLATRRDIYSELQLKDERNHALLLEDVESLALVLSTQLSTITAFSAAVPIFGLPIGLGIALQPDAFDIQASDIHYQINGLIYFRENR